MKLKKLYSKVKVNKSKTKILDKMYYVKGREIDEKYFKNTLRKNKLKRII